MVVQNIQRMTADTIGKRKISFEICLPHDVRLLLFKALDMLRRQARFLADEMVARKDIVERAHAGQSFMSHVFHHLVQLFRAQSRVLPTKLNDARFDLRSDSAGLRFGRAAPV